MLHEIYSVLIDTWWNVNMSGSGNELKTDLVLIDTWWNVNEFKSIYLKVDKQF